MKASLEQCTSRMYLIRCSKLTDINFAMSVFNFEKPFISAITFIVSGCMIGVIPDIGHLVAFIFVPIPCRCTIQHTTKFLLRPVWLKRRKMQVCVIVENLMGEASTREIALTAFKLGISSVHPKQLIPSVVQREEGKLRISLASGLVEKNIAEIDKVIVIGGGKVRRGSSYSN